MYYDQSENSLYYDDDSDLHGDQSAEDEFFNEMSQNGFEGSSYRM